MRHPDLRHTRQRLQAAHLSGECERLAVGDRKDLPDTEALRIIAEVTSDPEVIGYVLGSYRHRTAELGAYRRAVDLLEQAGPDEDIAAAVLAWHRWKQTQVNQSGIIL